MAISRLPTSPTEAATCSGEGLRARGGFSRTRRQLADRDRHHRVLRRPVWALYPRTRAMHSPLLATSAGVVDHAPRRDTVSAIRIVGRDVLFSVLLGVLIALVVRGALLRQRRAGTADDGASDGAACNVRELLGQMVYATRTALFTFFLMFLFRRLLRNQWLGAFAFVSLMATLNALTSERPWFDTASDASYYSMFGLAVMSLGAHDARGRGLIADLLLIVPATSSLSAWYLGEMTLVLAIPLALASWRL